MVIKVTRSPNKLIFNLTLKALGTISNHMQVLSYIEYKLLDVST